MKTFLEIVANDLYTKLDGNFENVSVVFPNKRASIFFNSHLASISDKPIWAPRYTTISELFQSLSTRTLADREVALLLLNTPYTVSYEAVAGQIDIYPTLLDVMGCNEYPWKGLGYSLLRTPVKSAVYWDRSVVGDTRSPLVPRQREAWDISNLILTGHYFESYSMRADE